MPLPADANVTVPGFAFAIATSSAVVLAGNAALTTRMNGEVASSETGAKSFCGS